MRLCNLRPRTSKIFWNTKPLILGPRPRHFSRLYKFTYNGTSGTGTMVQDVYVCLDMPLFTELLILHRTIHNP